jgi:phosphoribosylanthranilate isomerase
VTNEQTADAIAAHVRRTHPTTVQILSPIDPAESARLAELEPHLRRVQVVHVESRAALEMIPVYGPYVHTFLLDSGRPNAATPELGGTGRPHDWAVRAEFVAGGLSPSNVADAIRQIRPFGVDLCSGVRTEGRLDPRKLEAFFLAARGADEGRISA